MRASNACSSNMRRREDGRGGVIRTRDPLLPKQMRYQAALRPVTFQSGRCLATSAVAPQRTALSGLRDQLDLEQLGPPLAGDEQPVALGVVGDAVEHVVGVARGVGGGQ